MPKLTPQQRSFIRKQTRIPDLDPSEAAGELNIVPFLDIVMNLILFLLATTTVVIALGQLDSQLPNVRRSVGGRPPPTERALNLNVTVAENGIIVAGAGGKLAPGCTQTATGRILTVPKRGNEYDWTALTDCVERVHQRFPDESQVTISADPLVEYQHLIRAMDSVREKNGAELFPQVLLSAGVR